LPCRITVVDSRAEWLRRLPQAHNLTAIHAEEPASIVPTLPDKAYLVVMTMGHATDRPVLKRALMERAFPFIGVIGSDAKAAILRRELAEDGVPAELAVKFHCPIGLEFGTNHPHEIALSIAAQLLTERDRMQADGKKR
jgi:xanthine dehydrogenase accessory factor